MSEENSVVRLVTEQVMEQFGDRFEEALARLTEQAQAHIRQQLDQLIPGELVELPVPVDPKADARERAGRTAVQGAIGTGVVAVLLAVAAVIGGGDFDFTSAGDWKLVAGAAGSALLAAGVAYVQRLVKPPKGLER